MLLIICLRQRVDMLVHQPLDLPHNMRGNAAISGRPNRLKPKVALSKSTANMVAWRLAASSESK
jgi:hypothetical protein